VANVPYARPAVSRLRLTQSPLSIKILVCVLWVLVLFCAASTCALLWAGYLREVSLPVSTPDRSLEAANSLELLVLTALLYLVMMTALTLTLVSVLRRGSWLEGQTLVIRGLGTRRFDLARSGLSIRTSSRIPRLTLRATATSRRVRLPLGNTSWEIMAAPKLIALADAIAATGRQDPDAMQVIAGLRMTVARKWGWSTPPGVMRPG
jgi:hypothetical protein